MSETNCAETAYPTRDTMIPAANIDVGTSIDLTLQLPGEGTDIKAVARVVREAGGSEGRCWSGVEFLIVRGDGRDRLQSFVGDTPQA